MTCMTCGFPQDGSQPDHTFYSLPVRDDNVYELTCRKGHKTTTVLQSERFEILFEIAVQAIADGYCREAVASASSSVERLYEYFVRVACTARDIAPEVFEESWKQVKNQSERQLGMYIATYMTVTGQAPTLLSSAQVSFRNEVVHKGLIPTRDEAIKFLNELLEIAQPVVILIKQRQTLIDAAQKLAMRRVSERHKSAPVGPKATMAYTAPLCMSIALSVPHETTITKRLADIETRRFHPFR